MSPTQVEIPSNRGSGRFVVPRVRQPCQSTLIRKPDAAGRLFLGRHSRNNRGAGQSAILGVMTDVTQILSRIESGDVKASADLLPLVYEELHRLATARLVHERPNQTLGATALVHEAYLRLVGPANDQDQQWPTRGYFFAAAAEAMRRLLVEQARRKQRLRHGGGRQRVDLDCELLISDDGDDALIALDEALQRFAAEEPQAAEVVELRYFVGLTIEETARAMNLSVRTVNRHWTYARAWLYRQIGDARR